MMKIFQNWVFLYARARFAHYPSLARACARGRKNPLLASVVKRKTSGEISLFADICNTLKEIQLRYSYRLL